MPIVLHLQSKILTQIREAAPASSELFDSAHNKIYYFVDDIYYRETPGEGIDPVFPKAISLP